MPNVRSISFGKKSALTGDEADAYALQRAQDLAKALQQQAFTPLEGHGAPLSITQGLAQLMQAYAAKSQGDKAQSLAQKLQNSRDLGVERKAQMALPQNAQIDSVDGSAPTAMQSQYRNAAGEQMSIPAHQLAQALQGVPGADQALSSTLINRIIPPPDKFSTGPAGSGIINDRTGQLVGQVPEKPNAEDRALVEIVDKSAPGGHRTIQRQHFTEGKDQIWEKPNQSVILASQATPGGLDAMVEDYLQNNRVPPQARNPAVGLKFWAAVKARADADGNTLASQTANTRIRGSLKPAMDLNQKQLAANQSFLGTMDKNIASADKVAKAVGGDGSPIINSIFNKWKRGVTGDPQVAQFDVWNNSIQGEAAKIASGGVGSVSAASDTQIKKQVQQLNSAQNYQQWRAAADALLQEGHNRINSIKEENANLLQASGATVPTPTPAPASSITDIQSAAQAELARRRASGSK